VGRNIFLKDTRTVSLLTDRLRGGANILVILVTGIYTIFNQSEGITSACLRFENEMNKMRLELLSYKKLAVGRRMLALY